MDSVTLTQAAPVASKTRPLMYAVEVRTDEYEPVYGRGDRLIIRSDISPLQGRALVVFRDGRQQVLELIARKPGSLVVEPLVGGEAYSINTSLVDHVHAVVGSTIEN